MMESTAKVSSEIVQKVLNHSTITSETSSIFMDMIYTVEMYNKVICTLYNANAQISSKLPKLSFSSLLRSVSVGGSGEYLLSIVRLLLSTAINQLKINSNVTSHCLNMKTISVDELNTDQLVLLLLYSTWPEAKGLFRDFESRILEMESIADLSIRTVLRLCCRLVEYLAYKV